MGSITRHFATVDGRQVHYRLAGSGPPVVMLHMSPVSSRIFETVMPSWADALTIIAPDRPGYGLSDPLLEETPELEHFALDLAAFVDCLGLDRFGLLGAYTGAMVAAEFARLYPERPTVTILDGYVVLSDALRRDILANYFADHDPKPDGGHMAHLWARIRDQYLYWPWYNKTAAGRAPRGPKLDVPPADQIQADVLDLLRTGRYEGSGYGAAFRADGVRLFQEISSRCCLLGHDADILIDDLLSELPPNLPDNIRIERYRTAAESFVLAKELLLDAAVGDSPKLPYSPPPGGRLWSDFIEVDSGQIYVRRSAEENGKPLVLIHDMGASSKQWSEALDVLQSRRPTLAFDLPGHGETGAAAGNGPMTLSFMAEKIAEALTTLNITDIDLVSMGGGGLVALDLVLRSPSLAASLVAIDFWLLAEDEAAALSGDLAPELTPRSHGGHLLAAWMAARDGELYWPWFEPVVDNSIDDPPDLDLDLVQRNAADLLKAAPWHRDAVASATAYDAKSGLRKVAIPISFAPRLGGRHEARCERAKLLARDAKVLSVPIDVLQNGPALLRLLDG